MTAPLQTPLAASPIPVARWSAVCGVVAAATVAIACLIRPVDTRAIMAAGVTTLVAAVVSLAAVNALRRLGGSWAALAPMIAMPVRFFLSLSAAAALSTLAHLPAVPTMLTMISTYLALLVAETWLMYSFVQAEANA